MDASATRVQVGRLCIGAALFGLAVFVFPAFAHAATLFISPAAQSVAVGQEFTLTIDVSSADVAMNAASGDISFPSNKLQVLSISKSNSVMNLWIRDPSFTNSVAGGNVHFEGIVLNPGFIGATGNLITITFEAIAPGDAPISFSMGAVLANDGNGTNILSGMQSGDITIVPSSLPSAQPGSVSAPTSATQLPIGPLFLSELPDQDPTNPQPIFTWWTPGAALKGVTYKVKIGDGDWFNAATILIPNTKNQYQLPLQAPASSIGLAVAAFDSSGDSVSSTISFSVAPIASPSIIDFTRTIPATHQLFSVEGSAPTGTTIQIYLQKSGSILVYTAQTDESGHWSLANEATLAAGTWNLYAKAVDARGALSEATPVYHIQVSSWFDGLFSQIVGWGVAALAIILLLGGIIFLALNIIHSIRKWRVVSNREVIELEDRLRRDLDRIEKELDHNKTE
jgi:hypothetical protein